MEGIDVQVPGILTHCSSGRRRSSVSSSPEFEFWMLRNPSLPQPDLLSADQLFSDGVLLPLDLVPQDHPRISQEDLAENPTASHAEVTAEGTGSDGPGVSPAVVGGSAAAASAVGGSKRWRDIFKKGEKKSPKGGNEETVVKEKKRGGVGGGATAAELNINIWPFSRSRSAGNGGARPRVGAGSGMAHRKVSSAPCSRSNSAGESKSRKWPGSPTRVRVHLGRSSPVQVRRSGASAGRTVEIPSKSGEKSLKKEGEPDKNLIKDARVPKSVKRDGTEVRRKTHAAAHGGATNGVPKARVLSLNVPMCIGYRNNLSCRSDVGRSSVSASAPAASDDGECGGGGVPGEAVRGGHLFNIRNLFTITKRVY